MESEESEESVVKFRFLFRLDLLTDHKPAAPS
jgi:hypothetical protein